MGALLRIFRLFWITKISPLKSIHLKKILAKFSYPKNSQNQKFQTQKIPRQEPMHLWNPSLPKITCLISSFTVLWSVLCHWANCLGGGGGGTPKWKRQEAHLVGGGRQRISLVWISKPVILEKEVKSLGILYFASSRLQFQLILCHLWLF